ncbi:MAG: SMP-30/gluconolactonase/LRE family protein [Acidimicrobiales bacterium]|nr:SMP-30/gluconolactonase/LRE family protein [Acidimicrobiales bacterium]
MTALAPVLDGLAFPEGPRWHDGRLWFSDMHDERVLALDPATGDVETIVEVPTRPSGLGWRPDGTLLVVSMTDRCLLAVDGGRLVVVADLGHLATFDCNDMVVDGAGNAYVGNFGFDLHDPESDQCTATLALVTVDGAVRAVAEDLFFPNGAVITPDGSTLIVGESFGACLTAFDIEADGSLSNRREWARVKGAVPDGICLDAAGAVWMASPISHQVVRVAEGGEVLDEVRTNDERQPFACMLGGDDGRTLFVCTAIESDPEACRRQRAGRIETATVDVAHAGLP